MLYLSCNINEILIVSIDRFIQLIFQARAIATQLISQWFQRGDTAVLSNEGCSMKSFTLEFFFVENVLLITPYYFCCRRRGHVCWHQALIKKQYWIIRPSFMALCCTTASKHYCILGQLQLRTPPPICKKEACGGRRERNCGGEEGHMHEERGEMGNLVSVCGTIQNISRFLSIRDLTWHCGVYSFMSLGRSQDWKY